MTLIKVQWEVQIIESERGWGSKVDDTKIFDKEQDALDFVENFNKDNNKDVVPDWYMYAEDPVMVRVK